MDSGWNSKCTSHIINLRFRVFSDCLFNLLWYRILQHQGLLKKTLKEFNTKKLGIYNIFVRDDVVKVRKKQGSQGSKELSESARRPDPVTLKQVTSCKIWGTCCKASLCAEGQSPKPGSVTVVTRILPCRLLPNPLAVTVTDEK